MTGGGLLLRGAGRMVALSAVLWLAPPAQAFECIGPRLTTMAYCNDCRVEGAFTTSRDQPCERPARPREADNVQILSARISQRAKHGIAGSNVNYIAYAPGKGFVGKDDFVVEFAYRQGTQAGKVYVHFDVTVQ